MPTSQEIKKQVKKLGIIAGGGRLPSLLVRACHEQNIEPYVLAFKEHTDPALVIDIAHSWTHLGALQKNIDLLKAEKINDLVFCGDIKRPSLRDLKPDRRVAKFFMRQSLKALGDNDFLTAIKDEIAKDGFTLHGVHAFIDTLLAPSGVLGVVKPSPQNLKDSEYGFKISQEIGRLDIGQSVIVQDGIVIGVEAVEGTDALIERVQPLLKISKNKGVLIKTCKPQQEKELDLPTIGVQTIEKIVHSGLAGITIHAGQSLIIDIEAVIACANKANIFLYGIDP